MQYKKLSSILEYTAWLFKKYQEIQHAPQTNIYRIAEIKKTLTGQYKIVIQIIGKSTFIECTPHEIVSDDRLLEGFSKIDVRTITYYACEAQIQKPKYKLIVQEFSDKINRMLFRIKKIDNDEAVTKTASQIVLDRNLINDLSQEDVHSISYIAGYEHSQNEKDALEK